MAKSFNNTLNNSNPALQFISRPNPQQEQELEITESNYTPTEEEQEALKEYENTPKNERPRVEKRGRPKSKAEIKSQRVQLVLKQSTLEEANNRAETLGLSRNEYITKLIELDAHKNLIK